VVRRRRDRSRSAPGNRGENARKMAAHKYDFYRIAHEHLCAFRNPAEGESPKDHEYSLKR